MGITECPRGGGGGPEEEEEESGSSAMDVVEDFEEIAESPQGFTQFVFGIEEKKKDEDCSAIVIFVFLNLQELLFATFNCMPEINMKKMNFFNV